MSGPTNRSSLELYRDCLRLVRHIAPGQSAKAVALKDTVRKQFKQNMKQTDDVQIENLKANAVRALSNYMLFQSAQQDNQLQQAMKEQISNVKEKNRRSTTTLANKSVNNTSTIELNEQQENDSNDEYRESKSESS